MRSLSAKHDRRNLRTRSADADNGLVAHEHVRRMRLPVHEEAVRQRAVILRRKCREGGLRQETGRRQQNGMFRHAPILAFEDAPSNPLLGGRGEQ